MMNVFDVGLSARPMSLHCENNSDSVFQKLITIYPECDSNGQELEPNSIDEITLLKLS